MELKLRVFLADGSSIASDLVSFLERSGFIVSTAVEGKQALSLIPSFDPDLIILDVLLPHINGRDVLRYLRRDGNWTPIIMLGEVGDAAERAMALDEGADDYLLKPIAAQEVVSRIKAILRRINSNTFTTSSAGYFICGDLKFDRTTHRTYLRDKPLKLTSKALVLLEYLMTHPGELLTREQLLDAVWGWDYPLGTRAVDARIAELRHMLHDDIKMPKFIETVRGYGYRFLGNVRTISNKTQTHRHSIFAETSSGSPNVTKL